MKYLLFSTSLLVCLVSVFVFSVAAQHSQTLLKINQSISFSLSPDEEKRFSISLKEDEIAKFNWLANDNLIISFKIYDSNNKIWLDANSFDFEYFIFIAPKSEEYSLVVKLEKTSEVTGKQNISLEYQNQFKLPVGAKLKDIRKINGYDVKILSVINKYKGEDSVVLIEKKGRLKKIMMFGGGGAAGFYFPDNTEKAFTDAAKQAIPLIKNTLDKTGDGVPDVIIEYFSGGAHCCSETHFINLGEIVETVDVAQTAHVGMVASGKSMKGGLLFETADNGFAYWLTSFAQSPFPNVVLEFRDGKLRPNFDLMKRPAPSLSVLKKRARIARQQLSLEPYKGQDNYDSVLYKEDVFPQPVFWGEMLNLIYTGHEDLAWQFLDVVWDSRKQGKQLFIRDFKNQLSNSQYWQMITENLSKK